MKFRLSPAAKRTLTNPSILLRAAMISLLVAAVLELVSYL